MLLPALALEYITGQPASFVHSKLKYYRSRNAVTGVYAPKCTCGRGIGSSVAVVFKVEHCEIRMQLCW